MKSMFATAFVLSLGLTGFGAGQALAQSGHGAHHGHAAASAAPTSEGGFSEGTVRRVNVDAGTVTIAHGPLANLDMPPMTMPFKVAGSASLDGLAAGDKIRFVADMDGDDFIVTTIEKKSD